MAIALGFVNAGLDEREFLDAMLDPANKGGDSVREIFHKNPSRARRYVELTFRKARYRVQEHPPRVARADVLAKVDEIERASGLVDWRGRGGASALAVWRAHTGINRRAGRREYSASARAVAEYAGVSLGATAMAQKRLVVLGLLKCVSRPAVGETTASTWRLLLLNGNKPPEQSYLPYGGCEMNCSSDCASVGHDVWPWKGLGKSKWRVWSSLATPQTAKEVAIFLGIRAEGVRHHLKMLARSGLCSRRDDGTWIRLSADLDAIAERMGIAGEANRERERHRRQRQEFIERVDRSDTDQVASCGCPRREQVGCMGADRVSRGRHGKAKHDPQNRARRVL